MRFLRRLHKWLGLIVGLQVLLWSVSGLMFAWLDHDQVSAEQSVRELEHAVLPPAAVLVEPARWATQAGRDDILEVRVATLLDQWVWRVQTTNGVGLYSATTGEPLALNENLVRELAQARYVGEGQLASVVFHPTATIETRDSAATWEARFDDAQQTTLYFAADDGRLVETRNSTWRLFDFFWMLHTMDFRGRDNFNNPLVITVGFAALWLSLSGLLLLLRSFRRQDFAFFIAWRRPAAEVREAR